MWANGEQRRLGALADSAAKHAREVNARAVQVSVDIGKEKTQYFEKIALACAGTIALVVSFVGSACRTVRSRLCLLRSRAGCANPQAWLLRYFSNSGCLPTMPSPKPDGRWDRHKQEKERYRRD